MSITRRKFLACGALAVGYCLNPADILSTQAKASDVALDGEKQNILVVIQLVGGNDAFNTVIPMSQGKYGRYADARPSLAVDQCHAIRLNQDFALHPSMKGLAQLFALKELAILQSVGYPGASRSHFRSTEIWQTGYPDRIAKTGWLDNALIPPAVCVDTAMPIALGQGYPEGRLGRNLEVIASMIKRGASCTVYTTGMDGFDTHTHQRATHADLLQHLSQSLSAFQRDLRFAGKEKQVITLVFSEFGRSLKENGEGGTDHGASSTCLILGGSVKGGLWGESLSRKSLRDDSHFEIDFREVYATILDGWLKADSRRILGARYDSLGFV